MTDPLRLSPAALDRAERRIGELMAEQRETVGLATGTRGNIQSVVSGGSNSDPPKDTRPTLAERRIDKHLADRARTSRVPDSMVRRTSPPPYISCK
ncbi:MAG: hypothetical protein ACREFP_08990 [Acetobacteraceae bacterium]